MQNVPYVTVISPVKEVTLWGKADATVWRDYLHDEGYTPLISDGKVELLISAVDARYMGLRFQELSFSVLIGNNEYFLAHAYNSIAPFAYVERKFFRTPYYAGKLTVANDTIRLHDGQAFDAHLSPQAQLLREGHEDWELILRLPRALRKKAHQPHYFLARLQGFTEVYQASLINMQVDGADTIFHRLRESQFVAKEWRIREKATHSKSATQHAE